MEGMKYRLIIIFFVVLSSSLFGNNKKDIYNAYINNAMPVWKGIIDQLESKPEKSNDLLLELVNFQYGYIAWFIGNNHKDEALVYLKNSENNLKLLEENKFKISKIYGYKSAFYGFHISLSLFSAPFLGPKSTSAAKQAISTDPDDFFGYVQLGNVHFHAPSLMGGSKSEALKNYLKARKLMESKAQELSDDWNYLSLLVSIAKTYELLNDTTNAKLVYEEILKSEPQFKWVRGELYPKLIKKLK